MGLTVFVPEHHNIVPALGVGGRARMSMGSGACRTYSGAVIESTDYAHLLFLPLSQNVVTT